MTQAPNRSERSPIHAATVEWAFLFLILLIAAGVRLWQFGATPSGLYQDEAYEGLDALRVLAGYHPLYFPANNGREPLFVYLVAVSVGLFGRSPGAVRLPALLLGWLTVPATWLLGREFFGRRVGLLAAAVLAITFWPIQLSRIGLRAVALPLLIGLYLAAGSRAARTGRGSDWALAGGLFGLSVYTYLAARFAIVPLALFAAYWLLCRRPIPWRPLVIAGAVATIVIAPLAIVAAGDPEMVFGRSGQVSVLNPAINHGDLTGILGRQILAAVGMFAFAGDRIARHNLPGRPVFDPLLAVFAGAGLIACLIWAARSLGSSGRTFQDRGSHAALAILWVAAMVIPTILAEDAPHFLRAVGVWPVLALFPALGLDLSGHALEDWAMSHPAWIRRGPVVALGLTLASLAVSAGWTAHDYFIVYAGDPRTDYLFQGAASTLAAEVNRYTGIGWDGTGIQVRPANAADASPGRQVFVSQRYQDTFPSVRFLVPETPALHWLGPADQIATSGRSSLLLVLWPYESVRPYFDRLPAGAQVSVRIGPLGRGDLEKQAYPLYLAYQATPLAVPAVGPQARFAQSIHLKAAQVEAQGTHQVITLWWQADRPLDTDYSVYVHAQMPDGTLLTGDSQPGNGYLPTSWWRPGQVIVDQHMIPLLATAPSPAITVGLYHNDTLARLPVLDANGQVIGDGVTISAAHHAEANP